MKRNNLDRELVRRSFSVVMLELRHNAVSERKARLFLIQRFFGALTDLGAEHRAHTLLAIKAAAMFLLRRSFLRWFR